ncbi:DNA ligase D [Sphingobacterium cavernae]|uniref:DNA ligase D n=1 Tax=Sphingobacterium cavernae TaxID=2592657 RepID=UPI00122FD169|nr:DNA ligase D [Sphingobacterium cavernae]
MGLEEYNQKRNFKETSEPEGKKSRKGKKLQFVVQRHAASRLHYDFRLEVDGVLKSWAVPKGPSLNPDDKRLAMMVEDHPFAYRTFEGTIPKGNYGAGEVEIWDKGYYVPLNKTKGKPQDKLRQEELDDGSVKIILYGEKLQGEFALVKIKNGDQDNAWLLIKHNDKFAVSKKYDAENYAASDSKVTAYLGNKRKSKGNSSSKEKIIKLTNSRTTQEKKLPETITPMLCKVSKKPFDGEDWAFEIKWDGYRAIADLRNDKTQFYSRNGLDFSRKFPKIFNALKLQSYEMVLDGEIVAYDSSGKPSFNRIQNLDDDQQAVVFQVFDLLWLNGHSTQELTYLQRKELLSEALVANEVIQYHDFVLENGKAFFKEAQNLGLEGIIAKKIDSYYTSNVRSSEWLKIKIQQTEEALICGFTEAKGSRNKFGSLVLGKYLDDELVFCGHVGTGFKEKDLNELHSKMLPLERKSSPFQKVPKTNGKTTWIKPELVAEIKFTELTNDLIYRHPVFLHLREDKESTTVYFSADEELKTAEKNTPMNISTSSKSSIKKRDVTKKIGGQQLKLTNQDKIYFPELEISKSMVIDYYQSMATFILPHLKDRAQSLNRFPNGIDGMSFYQKDAADETPNWIPTQEVYSESTDKYIDYMICNDKATMAYLNNLGCIEFNPWTSKISNLDKPSYLVLDLDPSDNNSFEDVIEVAQAVKLILDQGRIEGYPKTSGSTGMHIYIPMNAKYTFDQVKDFGHVLMQMVQLKLPKLTTLERSLQKRDKSKIYLDYLQNRRGQTLASVYSLRPKKEATVSMPLTWEEVRSGLKPSDFTIFNALDRVKEKGDLFKPVLGKGVDILKAIKNLEYEK